MIFVLIFLVQTTVSLMQCCVCGNGTLTLGKCLAVSYKTKHTPSL